MTLNTRSQQTILFIGAVNCGKTTMCLHAARATGKPLIVVNKGEFPTVYDSWQKVNIEQLKKWTGSECLVQIDIDELNNVCEVLMSHQKNTIVVFEDAFRYVPQSIQKGAFLDLLCDLRKANLELFFMYHMLKQVPPTVANYYKMMFLFKTTDYLSRHDLKKFPNTQTIITAATRIEKKFKANPHYSECIFFYE